MSDQFEVKFFGKMETCIGWEIKQGTQGIMNSQNRYARDLLKKHGLSEANGADSAPEGR